MKKCSFENCLRDVKARGWCQTHYMQWRRRGKVKALRWSAPVQPCSVSECSRDSIINGQCAKHHKADLRRAEPGSIPGSEDRFWSHVSKSATCWEWTGQALGGYGRFDGWLAHRYAWRLAGHELDEELFIDHKCRNRACVNPEHLHQVTRKHNQENLGVRADNKTGYRGVTYRADHDVYVATVGHHGKRIYVGRFKTPEEAGEAARRKRLELFSNSLSDMVS